VTVSARHAALRSILWVCEVTVDGFLPLTTRLSPEDRGGAVSGTFN